MKVYIRSQYYAPKDYVLIQADFSQAESWIVAALANEEQMFSALKLGIIHEQTASVLFDMTLEQARAKEPRYVGKRYNHASAYRMSYLRAAEVINADSDKPPFVTVTNEQSKKFSEKWHKFYNVRGWWYDIECQLKTNRTLITPYHRKRQFFGMWGDELFKEATAFVPQSTVADHAYGRVQKELGVVGGFIGVSKLRSVTSGECRLVNTAHDSIMLEVPKSIAYAVAAEVYSCLARPIVVRDRMFTIPVDVEIGERWSEMEKIKKEMLGI